MKEAEHEKQEREANQFAMELLMPEPLVRAEIQKLITAKGKGGSVDLCDDRWVQQLAKKFQVPFTVMAIRIGQLYPKP